MAGRENGEAGDAGTPAAHVHADPRLVLFPKSFSTSRSRLLNMELVVLVWIVCAVLPFGRWRVDWCGQ